MQACFHQILVQFCPEHFQTKDLCSLHKKKKVARQGNLTKEPGVCDCVPSSRNYSCLPPSVTQQNNKHCVISSKWRDTLHNVLEKRRSLSLSSLVLCPLSLCVCLSSLSLSHTQRQPLNFEWCVVWSHLFCFHSINLSFCVLQLRSFLFCTYFTKAVFTEKTSFVLRTGLCWGILIQRQD